jgi:tetratricopeptide (TPR) repeat protein
VTGAADSKQDLQQRMASARRNSELLRAGHALFTNDLPTAEGVLRPYLKQRPTDVAAIRMMAELAARVGRLADSENLLRRAIELAPGFNAARSNLATVLYKQNRPLDAIAELDEIARSEDMGTLGNAGLRAAAMGRVGRLDEARDLYRSLLAARPDEPKLWMSYGHILKTVGDQADSVDAYRRSIDLRPALGEAWWSLANLKTVRFTADDIGAMEAGLADSAVAIEDRFHLHFALGKALEDAGAAEAGFRHYAEGNLLRRSLVKYDPADIHDHAERSAALYTTEFFAERAGWGCSSADPIFILGMPRAGSTLIEQILSSHSAIEGTAELPDMPALTRRLAGRGGGNPSYLDAISALTADDALGLGEEYLERAGVQRFTDKPFFIDKLPNNWLHIGLIRLILPNAKIIDARRDPLSCGFSNFKQHFARGQNWAYDLAEIGSYYRDYVTLMRHVDTAMPGFVLRVIHEDLVDDPEAQVRRMLDFLGLPFEPACLSFHENRRAVRTASSEQVRRPISRDGLEQWKPFEAWLEPLKTALGPVLQDWRI